MWHEEERSSGVAFCGQEHLVEKVHYAEKEELLEAIVTRLWQIRALKPAFVLLPDSMRLKTNFLILRFKKIHAETLAAIVQSDLDHPETQKNLKKIIHLLKVTRHQWRAAEFIHGDLHLHNILYDGQRLFVIDPELPSHKHRFHRRYSHWLARTPLKNSLFMKRKNEDYAFNMILKDLQSLLI